MTPINITESDRATANKYLKIGIASSVTFGSGIYFFYTKNKIDEIFFAIPFAALFFNLLIYGYYRKRNQVNSVNINKISFSYNINGNNKSFRLDSIRKIEVEKIWGSEKSIFTFYLCTDSDRERIPRLESITDTKIVKYLIEANPEIDANEAKKVFSI